MHCFSIIDKAIDIMAPPKRWNVRGRDEMREKGGKGKSKTKKDILSLVSIDLAIEHGECMRTGKIKSSTNTGFHLHYHLFESS